MAYVVLALDDLGDDPDVLTTAAIETFKALLLAQTGAEWVPVDGDPAAALLATFSGQNGELRTLVRSVARDDLFAVFGRTVLRVPQVAASTAALTATVALADHGAHTVPAGLRWTAGGVVFEVLADTLVPDSTATPAVQPTVAVEMAAVEPGAAGNAATVGGVLAPVDALPWIVGATVAVAAAGGVDAETVEEFTARLSDVTGTLRTGVANARDAAILARSVPGVHRALAIDGWDPTDDTLGNEMEVGVAAVDEAGAALPAPVKTALIDYLTRDDVRTLNVIVRVADPTVTAVAVAFTAVAAPEFDPAAVQAAGEAAVAGALDKGVWGGGGEDPPAWHADAKTVRYLDVAAELGRVDGLEHLVTLTLNGGAADVVLAGRAALPSPVTVAGTVTAP